MKWVAVAYIIAVLVLSAKAKALNDDSVENVNSSDFSIDYQAKLSE